MNKILENFLKKTLWLWLPFYALFYLIREAIEKIEKNKAAQKN